MSLFSIVIYSLFILLILYSLFSLYKFELDKSDNSLSGKILKFSALTVGALFLLWYVNWYKNLLIRYISYSLL